jgi:ribosome-associated protein
MKEEDAIDDTLVSKSQIKRDADTLVALGKKIAGLSKDQFDGMSMSDELRESIVEVKKLSKGGAIKRQFKYIGKLLRDSDIEELSKALERQLEVDRSAAARLHMLETWRDRLVQEGDAALADFISKFPQADRQHIRQLQRKAIQELERAKPPTASRKIFQYIKEITLAD